VADCYVNKTDQGFSTIILEAVYKDIKYSQSTGEETILYLSQQNNFLENNEIDQKSILKTQHCRQSVHG